MYIENLRKSPIYAIKILVSNRIWFTSVWSLASESHFLFVNMFLMYNEYYKICLILTGHNLSLKHILGDCYHYKYLYFLFKQIIHWIIILGRINPQKTFLVLLQVSILGFS